jgi:hypothetical protein
MDEVVRGAGDMKPGEAAFDISERDAVDGFGVSGRATSVVGSGWCCKGA